MFLNMLQSILARSKKIIVFYQSVFLNIMKFSPLLLKGFFSPLFLYISEVTQDIASIVLEMQELGYFLR